MNDLYTKCVPGVKPLNLENVRGFRAPSLFIVHVHVTAHFIERHCPGDRPFGFDGLACIAGKKMGIEGDTM